MPSIHYGIDDFGFSRRREYLAPLKGPKGNQGKWHWRWLCDDCGRPREQHHVVARLDLGADREDALVLDGAEKNCQIGELPLNGRDRGR